ncbi:SPOR domain-containing protein [Tamlana sp. 62-3]|uniref:SPOR domain-containing protein n=1 Tax=Neotamlana sargassicola TaxID=2883125 RepID=A0A9X1I5B6_9FLAO|nr:SPOR domain-containing protein [Tamlana sargassicola]MCB4808136.1 SPOR domain-containing protein [Tamlana sargassicola]
MKKAYCIVLFLFVSVSIFGQRVVFPNQNPINPYLDDPSFLALNGRYNMTGIIQASDTNISNTSQYVNAQLAPFDNFAFGLDYSNHSYQIYHYTQLFLNTRFKFNLGNEFNYINLGASIGIDRVNENRSSNDNSFSSVYKLGAHYTNFNLTIGGFLTTYPIQNDLSLAPTEPLTSSDGYTAYAAYRIRVSDNLRITPMAKYNSYSDLNIVEGVANINYKGNYELALSYKDDYSFNTVISGRFFKYFRVSYSLESALGSQNFNRVHSVGVSVDLTPKEQEIPEWLANVKRSREKLGRKKKEKKPEPTIVETVEEIVETEEIAEEVIPETNTDEDNIISTPVMSEDSPSDIVNGVLKSGYYIILGSFVNESNANKEVERLKSQGIYARAGRKNGDKFYYIYVDRYDDKDLAVERTFGKQKEDGFNKVWLLRVK